MRLGGFKPLLTETAGKHRALTLPLLVHYLRSKCGFMFNRECCGDSFESKVSHDYLSNGPGNIKSKPEGPLC